MAGNALATHDVEGTMFGTALGQKIYSKASVHQGHYKHLDALNRIRSVGSMEAAIRTNVQDFVVTVERGLRRRTESD